MSDIGEHASGVNLPPRHIQPPQSLSGFMVRRLAPAVAVAVALVLVVNHRTSGLIAALITILGIGLVAGITVPLVLRGQRRGRERTLAKLPSGTFYRGTASVVGVSPTSPQRRVGGVLVLDRDGLVFTPQAGSAIGDIRVRWNEITNLQLRPSRGQPLVGALELTLVDGGTQRILVSFYGQMAKILESMP